MNNKELIKKAEEWLHVNLMYKGRIDSYSIIEGFKKALQDAEADAKKQAAIHLHEEAKLLQEINRLKAEIEVRKNRNLKDTDEISRLKAELHKANIDCFNAELDHQELKAKLSEQVDPIELIEFTAKKYGLKIEIGKDIAEKVFEQFKKEEL